jgi:Cation transporting ATPase, C-terminus
VQCRVEETDCFINSLFLLPAFLFLLQIAPNLSLPFFPYLPSSTCTHTPPNLPLLTFSLSPSLCVTVLVTIELLKALSAVSLDSSLLRVQPWQNPWLIPGVLIPFALHLLVVYIPPLAHIFSLSPLSWKEWKVCYLCYAVAWCVVVWCGALCLQRRM